MSNSLSPLPTYPSPIFSFHLRALTKHHPSDVDPTYINVGEVLARRSLLEWNTTRLTRQFESHSFTWFLSNSVPTDTHLACYASMRLAHMDAIREAVYLPQWENTK